MTSSHLIEEARVDIAFTSEEVAGSQQVVLSDFINDLLLNSVDEVFDENSEAGAVLRIEKLEIDLGVVPFQNYQEEMVVRLREYLSDRLRSLKFRAHRGDGSETVLSPLAVTEFEVVETILRNGYQPWYSRFYSVDEMQQLMLRVVESQSESLIRLLDRIPVRSAAYERVIEILPLGGLPVLARALLYRSFHELSWLLDRLADYQLSVGGLDSISNISRGDILSDLWKVVVRLLLHAAENRRDVSLLVGALLRQCVSANEVRFGQLRDYLVEQGLDEIVSFDSLIISDSSRQQAGREEVLQYQLDRAVTRAAAEDDVVTLSQLSEWLSSDEDAAVMKVVAHWGQLLELYPDQLTGLLRSYGHRADARRAWVRNFSSTQLAEIIGLLEVAVSGFISSTIHCYSGFSDDTVRLSSRQSEVGGQKSGVDEKLLWDFTFDFVFIERGNRFNKKAYCGSLLREMAAHNNRSYGELLGEMLQWLMAHAVHNSFMMEMLSIISELSDQYVVTGSVMDSVNLKIPAGDDGVALCDEIDAFLISRDEQKRRSLIRLLGDERRARAIADMVDREKFEELIHAVIGEGCREQMRFAKPLVAAVERTQTSIASEVLQREYLLCCCRYLIDAPPVTVAAFVQRLAQRLLSLSAAPKERHYSDLLSQLRKAPVADSTTVASTIDALMSTVTDLGRVEVAGDNEVTLRATGSENQTEDLFRDEKPIYIRNAGQVLLAPYLPTLFSRMGLLEEGRFIDLAATGRAVTALQYLVDGVGVAPEYLMVLNKLLCGVESQRPTPGQYRLNSEEKALVDGLLTAAIENWTAVGKTSIAGLRESFLQREGRLVLNDEKWQLRVESRSYDMLLDRLPWSFSTVKFGWMPRPIHVEWR